MIAKWQNNYTKYGCNYEMHLLVYKLGYLTIILTKDIELSSYSSYKDTLISFRIIHDNGLITGYDFHPDCDPFTEPAYEIYEADDELYDDMININDIPNKLMNWILYQFNEKQEYPHFLDLDPYDPRYSNDYI